MQCVNKIILHHIQLLQQDIVFYSHFKNILIFICFIKALHSTDVFMENTYINFLLLDRFSYPKI